MALLNFISEHHVALSLIFTIVSGVSAWLARWYNTNTQKNMEQFRNDLQKETEQYKHELQSTFIKTELKTKQLYNIYLKLFSLFKTVEASLNILRGPVKRLRVIEEQDLKGPRNEFIEANNYLSFNLLFLSKKVRDLAIKAKDLMAKCFVAESEENGKKFFEQVANAIEALEIQMKKELDGKQNT